MNHWPFIIASYALTLLATLALALWSWSAMRRAEKAVDELGRRQ
jgi:heme exporter protein CcmD